MSPELLVVSAILLCAAGAVLTAAVSRWQLAAGGLALLTALVSAGLVGTAVVHVFAHGPSAEPAAFLVIPWLGFSPRFHVDGLSSVFLSLAATLAVPVTLHSIGYLRARHPGRGTREYYPCLLLFLSAMYGLTSTTDMMWFFLFFWQLMTLPGFFLIRYERGREAARAAYRYMWMMQAACGVTMLGALILVSAGQVTAFRPENPFDLAAVAAKLPSALARYPWPSAFAFLLFLVGFGIKMGMWPFGQIWLPDAHPAAPSPISAMLSGVMIKTGVYGLLRYFLWLVPAEAAGLFPLERWGAGVAVLGTLTLFTGTAQAMQQVRSKRLLAFSSIGQVGYILLGAGAAMALLGSGRPEARALAALALFGVLFHVVNHGLMKSLLFLDAGAMLCATGTQELDRMGGLMRHMPWTGLTALVASFAIAGVPPLNGFASKWVLYVATLRGSGVAWYLAPCAAVALLTGMLTLATFVKFLGVGFLGRRSAAVVAAAGQRRLEVSPLMLVPQVLLALCCLGLGLFPALAARAAAAVLAGSPGGLGAGLAGVEFASAGAVAGLEVAGGGAVHRPLVILALLGLLLLLARALGRLGGAERRATAPWLCGYAEEADLHRYSTHDLYGEVKGAFRLLGGAPPPRGGGGPEPGHEVAREARAGPGSEEVR